MNSKLGKLIRSIAVPISVVVLWQVWGSFQRVNNGLPDPSNVASIGWKMLRLGELELAMGISTLRVLIGFGFASAAAILIGIVMGYMKAVERNLDPLVQTFRMVAAIALAPMALIWFGSGGPAAIFIVAYGAFFPIIITTISGVRQIDESLVRAARTMGLNRREILHRVVLPASIPTIFVGLRLGLGTAWGAIIAAELIVGVNSHAVIAGGSTNGGPAASAAAGGIGYLMYFLFDHSVETGGIIVAMVAVGVAAFVMDRIVRWFQRFLTPWMKYAQ